MKIVIIGVGTIGNDILEALSNDKHIITVVDENKTLVENLIEKHDVQGVIGNGASIEVQEEAGMKNADIAIILTKSDELNIFACMVAKKLGVKNTIARVRNPEYKQQILSMKEELGISAIVNPEQDTANEIFNLINLPEIVEIEKFSNGKVLLAEVAVEKGCSLINKNLISIGKELNTKVLICAIKRGEEIFIPSGNTMIYEGDKICFTTNTRELRDFMIETNIVKAPLKNVMIVGGSKIAYYLVKQLCQKKYRVKLIEKDSEIADDLAEKLPSATIVNGSGTRHDTLIEEGIESMDAFIALSDIDEENMVMSMFANSSGVKKVITQIQNDDLHTLLSQLGIQNNVSSKDVVADYVISYVRGLSNSRGSNITSLCRIVNDKVEAIEFVAKKKEKFYKKPLNQLKTKDNCLIASIIRNGKVILPNGNTTIELGDNVIVVTTHTNFNDLSEIFE